MTKLLLINPPVSIYVNKTAFAPLSLLVLGTRLKEMKDKGIDISYELLDLDFLLKHGELSDDESFLQKAARLILDRNPDVLLFTVHGLNHIIVLGLSEIIRKSKPDVFIVVGGVGPTLKARDALERCPDIDVIVKGEGEGVLEPLIRNIIGHRDFSRVPSVVYREDGQVIENPRPSIDKDARIPRPDYSLIDIEKYVSHNQRNPYVHPGFVLIESGRGCPHACSFCAPAKMWGSIVRYRPIPEILEEMAFLAQKGGNFSFFTQDNLEEHFLRSLSEALIDKHSDILWGCYSRLDRLSDDIAPVIAKAGCRLIFTGFETPNRSAQKAIRKVLNASTAFEKLKLFNQHGIKFIGSFIAGFPDETDEDLENTMRFAMECSAGMQFDELCQYVQSRQQDQLPQKNNNICFVHPLCYMPGTDSFEKESRNLHISKYSLHPDCYGAYLFGHDHFKDDWSFLGGNPYLNHLPENLVRYYCSILRVFNFLNSRPFYLALLLGVLEKTPLQVARQVVGQLGEEFVLTAKIKAFEAGARGFVASYLEYTPEWTVKKGQ
ncbi:MAG: B12-binding domain-containing radical SAM protein [Desulfobacterales bacterium]